jgi:hypothetical protein
MVSVSNTSFEVSNFPTEQSITGMVSVSNFPTSFEVSNFPTEQSITGMVSISNFPTSFEVSNFPTEQSITGMVSVSNFPTVQDVNVQNPISGFASETTQNSILTKLNNGVSVNVLNTNTTIYDLTNDSGTMTENDSRFVVDRVRPDSWAFANGKNQNGSNVYWYSNSSASPLGVQEFPILHGDLSSLYCVVSINKTENNNRLPFMALFSPSQSAFYTSRWVYTIDPTEQLLQTEKVLLYWNNDPVNLYPNLRHIQLLKNAIASQGPQLETETIFLMSINTASGEPSGSISYNLYNSGFVLNNEVHSDYQFNSGIKSKGDLVLSELSVAGDGESLKVAVSNSISCSVENTVNVDNAVLSEMAFDTIDSKGTKGLLVITKDIYDPTVFTYTEADVNYFNNLPTIDLRPFNKLSIFGVSTHTGAGSHNIIVQYSDDGTTFYDSPNVITVVINNGIGSFSWDYSNLCVRYMRLHFQVQIQTLTCIISLK